MQGVSLENLYAQCEVSLCAKCVFVAYVGIIRNCLAARNNNFGAEIVNPGVALHLSPKKECQPHAKPQALHPKET